jgi:hypothetical protein
MVRIVPIRTTDIVSDNKAGLQRILLGTGLVGGILANDWWPNSEYARQCFYPAACWLGTIPQSIQLLFGQECMGFLVQSSELMLLYKISKSRPPPSQYRNNHHCLPLKLYTYHPQLGPRISREANHIGPGATASQSKELPFDAIFILFFVTFNATQSEIRVLYG